MLLEPGPRAVQQRRDRWKRPWWLAGQRHSWDPGEPRTHPRWSVRVLFPGLPSWRVTRRAEPSQLRPDPAGGAEAAARTRRDGVVG